MYFSLYSRSDSEECDYTNKADPRVQDGSSCFVMQGKHGHEKYDGRCLDLNEVRYFFIICLCFLLALRRNLIVL